MGLFEMIASAMGWKKKEARILVIGLDNSGKTTMIQYLKPQKGGAANEVTPTVGFQVEEFSKNDINFTVYDMSGQGRYRSLWEHYYAGVEAIIYVLDSTDRLRMCVAKEELEQLLAHADIKQGRAPVLFFANKMDIPGAMTPEECMEEMDLESVIRDKSWHIVPSNALTGSGVIEGIDWMCGQIARNGAYSKK